MTFFSNLFNSMPGALAQGLIWGIMAVGVFITYKVLGVADLTVDGTLALGGAVCIVLIRNGCNAFLAVFIACLCGAAAGLVTGLLHTACGIPAILAGILSQLALYSINLRIMDMKANLPVSVDSYDLVLSLRYVRTLSVQNPIPVALVFLAVIIGALYWFFGTERGSSLRATGSNVNMARSQGINTDVNVVLGLMLSNALVAVCGALLAQYQGFADVNAGRGAIVIGLAAVIIGEVIFSKIFRNFALRLVAVVLGAVIYYVVIQVVLQLGLDTNDLKLLTAIVVALFLTVPHIREKMRHTPRKKEVKNAGNL